MTAERRGPDIPDWAQKERASDLSRIAENHSSFWPVAQVQFAAQGRGVIVVDTTQQPDADAGHPMFSLPQAVAEQIGDEDVKRMLRECDPRREFVVVLLKPDEHTSTYRVQPVGRTSEKVQRGRPRRRHLLECLPHENPDIYG